jgi:hypothetical protein
MLSRILIAVAGVFSLLGDGLTEPARAESRPSAPPAVQVVKAPVGCFVPDVMIDRKGILHMVYALNQNAYYVRSNDCGGKWTRPIQVNSAGSVEFKMGERGPKLAVGKDGMIHVVWIDCWAPDVKTFVRYARSQNQGESFERMKTLSSTSGNDGVTMTADGAGHVAAFWHVANPPQAEVPQGTWLHMARSTDNGNTFAHDERVQIANHSGLACSMCMMRARTGADGALYLAFRSAEKSIRDFYVLKSASGENRFTAIRVNDDNWLFNECPMCGPELTVGPEGGLLCAFMSRHKVYWSVSDVRVASFQRHVATPSNENDEIYPTAVVNRHGDVLFVWQVGPMSTTATATVHWACYKPDGEFSGRQGVLGTTTSGTKATAFAGDDGTFYIVTTAQDRERR